MIILNLTLTIVYNMKNKIKKPRMMFIGNSPTIEHSGQSVVAKHLCTRFIRDYELGISGWCHDGSPDKVFNGAVEFPQNIHPFEAIKRYKPDVVFLCHDPYRFKDLHKIVGIHPCKYVGYFTVEAEPLPYEWKIVVEQCDIVIVPAEYSKRIIEDRTTKVHVEVVPFGVDCSLYGLRKDKKTMCQLGITQDDIVFLYVGMNQDRKNIGNLMEGFNNFDKKDECILIMLAHDNTIGLFGHTIPSNINISDPFRWRRMLHRLKYIPDNMPLDYVIKLYGVSDFYFCPSSTEGFGLGIVEAMASGSLPVVTDREPMNSIPQYMVPINVSSDFIGLWNMDRGISSSKDITKSMGIAYELYRNNNDDYKKMVNENLYIVKERYDWEKCADDITKIVKLVMENTVFSQSVRRFI